MKDLELDTGYAAKTPNCDLMEVWGGMARPLFVVDFSLRMLFAQLQRFKFVTRRKPFHRTPIHRHTAPDPRRTSVDL
ncbi:hypothetical protein AMATHDRAFT_3965 [Amanita thiersii Skay4041]|uniref:Uncharacterized protein n=1 Tax=Amanita thiersii Skay4041 TaxID=703135 RepID=A0A2A9NHD3_9AGAR|nr:hypothetical protein AMATHDRAFT_3965 [Amanita thiersii Skay4041]